MAHPVWPTSPNNNNNTPEQLSRLNPEEKKKTRIITACADVWREYRFNMLRCPTQKEEEELLGNILYARASFLQFQHLLVWSKEEKGGFLVGR